MVVEVNFLLRPQERIWKLHDQFCTCLPIAPHSLPVDSRDCGRIRSPKIRIKRSILKGTNINSGPGKNSSYRLEFFFLGKSLRDIVTTINMITHRIHLGSQRLRYILSLSLREIFRNRNPPPDLRKRLESFVTGVFSLSVLYRSLLS